MKFPVWVFVLGAALLLGGVPQFADAKCREPKPSIQAFDGTPLASRIPLLLVHGIDPDKGRYDNWDLYLETFMNSADFKARYKVYLYHYDTKLGVPKNSKLFHETLAGFVDTHDMDTLRVLAHSMGGLLLRDNADTPLVTRHVDRVITIASPFHGTPLTASPWILAQKSRFSPMHYIYKLAYKVTKKQYPTFASDYCWDNFDRSMPDKIKQQDCKPGGPIENDSTRWITYASFFTKDADARAWLATQLEAPPEVIARLENGNNKGAGLFGSHRAFVFAREKMRKLSLHDGYTSDVIEKPCSIMAFNDGVSPITSHLWLGRFQREFSDSNLPPETLLLEALKSCKKIPMGQARLFAGLDHADWMTGYSRIRRHDNRFTDLLHPEEKAKTVFDWALEDLLAE